ncbi:hypothetical protein Q5530_27070 [Saccharothrix sp. BKS2]|uniref:hypothetical protein n=1 Tax=Saccharothrix sp. BKS2 TaxID=3064400 RepID=UPI0039EB4FDF
MTPPVRLSALPTAQRSWGVDHARGAVGDDPRQVVAQGGRAQDDPGTGLPGHRVEVVRLVVRRVGPRLEAPVLLVPAALVAATTFREHRTAPSSGGAGAAHLTSTG